jgi:hypothetical protein
MRARFFHVIDGAPTVVLGVAFTPCQCSLTLWVIWSSKPKWRITKSSTTSAPTPEWGGKGRHPTPPDYFVASLSSCIAAFVQQYCAQSKIDATGNQVWRRLAIGITALLSAPGGFMRSNTALAIILEDN